MSQKVYCAWRRNRYTKLRRSLSEFIEPCKTGCDNTQKGHLLKATNIAVYIIILFLLLDLWERRNFQGRGVSCILNSTSIDFPFFVRIPRYSIWRRQPKPSETIVWYYNTWFIGLLTTGNWFTLSFVSQLRNEYAQKTC